MCLHADRAGLGIFWKACAGLNFGNFWEAFLVTRPAGEANVRLLPSPLLLELLTTDANIYNIPI